MSTIGPVCSELDGKPSTLRPLLLWWSVGLCALLVVEVLMFSIRIDTGALRGVDSPWAMVLAQSSFYTKMGITAAVALLVFGGDQLRQSMRGLVRQRGAEPIHWWPVFGHLIAVLAFYRLSLVIFGDHIQQTSHAWAWIAGWLAVGFTAMTFWVAAVAPVSLWPTIAQSTAKLMVVSVVLAAAALSFGRLADELWRPLAQSTFSIVQFVLELFYSNLIIRPNDLMIGTTSFTVNIAPSCSGYEGIGLVTVFLSAYLWWFRKDLRFPQSLLLIPIGIVAIWVANAVRIATLVVVGSSLSREIAAGGFHSQAGWLAFNAVTLALIAIACNASFFSRTVASRVLPSTKASYPAAAYLIPFLTLVATAMFTGAMSPGGFDRWYGLRVVTTAIALSYFLNRYRRLGFLNWSWSWFAVAIGGTVFVFWMVLEPFSAVAETDRVKQAAGFAGATSPSAIWMFFRIIGSVLIVPVAEELAFRGYLIRRLIDKNFDLVPLGQFSWFSCVVSSVVFGLMHGRWLAGTLAGLSFAAALYRRGRLTDAMMAHATANALVTSYVLATGNLAAWS